MQKYFINWKMRVMFYSSIDFHETLEKNKITDFLIDLFVCVKKDLALVLLYLIFL